MRSHPVIGCEIVSGIEFLEEAAQIVRHHHERWDGQGYPDGLPGEDIPLAARIFCRGRHLRRADHRPALPARGFEGRPALIAGGAGTSSTPPWSSSWTRCPMT